MSFFRKFTGAAWTYLKEVRREMQRVNWPERRDVARMTAAVVILSLVVALTLGGFDYLFSQTALRTLPGSAPAGVPAFPEGSDAGGSLPSVGVEQNIPLEVVGPEGEPIHPEGSGEAPVQGPEE